MKPLLFALAALFAVPAASAQRTGADDRMPMDYQAEYQADIDRLGRDLDRLDRTMTGDMRSDYTTYRQSYDQLRQSTPSMDMTDPEAARQARMDYGRRYDELAGNVYRARLSSARNRADYLQAADDRLGTYDDQIGTLHTRYKAATGDARADMAQRLISLRRQRDTYRDQLYSTRGMTRSGFDDVARRRATDSLARYDADFSRARREAMMPMDRSGSMDGSSM